MQMPTILWIALGGGLGTVLRYFIASSISTRPGFPYGTLAVNLIGCLAIGLIYGFFDRQEDASNSWKLILTVGLCGGFTTFSAFSADNLQLLRDGQAGLAILYTTVSVVGGLLCTYFGTLLLKS